MNFLDRVFQVVFTAGAVAFVAAGCLLTYAADPISGKLAPHSDGLMMIWVGYSLCLLPALIEVQLRFAHKASVVVKG